MSSDKFNAFYLLYGMELPVAHSEISNSIRLCVIPPFRLIEGQLGKVKGLIDKQLIVPAKSPAATMRQHGEEPINQLLDYANRRIGKMLRPGLVLLSGSTVGKVTQEHIRVAAIVEMIHNATLLHDDVIDQGQKRRGQPTINSLWGSELAVLLGDFLLSRVFKMCAELEPKVTKVIAATAARICEGELRQVTQRQNYRLSESQYLDIITQKSASFFGSCCRLGGLLAGANEKQIRALADFGLNAGIAFQITDDLLDIIGDERKTGKTLGSDVNRNKLTLALIHLLKVAKQKDKKMVMSFVHRPSSIVRRPSSARLGVAEGEAWVVCHPVKENKKYNKEILLWLLRSYGSLEYARSRAQEFVTKAIAALKCLKDSSAKTALIETARFMTNRVR